ncbi:MAG TPA: polysaccharide deacetylase family protein [Candidatus Paenibacillus intestinavium]|nr:polysaccharide deacetylase family protein [Candidatus Paenibacillus intestinavium]
MQWWKKASFILASTLALVVFIKFNGNLTSFIKHVQDQDAVYTFMQVNRTEAEKKDLYAQIEAEADAHKIEPINARIDRVFHAIPGYNGIEVDIEKTYEYNLQMVRGEKIRFIYKNTEPAVKLEDLGNHPIYKGNANKQMIGFMINVAWGNEYIESILSTLEREQVYATFFLDGTWLRDNKELAIKIQNAGHELSNHAYSHPDMAKLSRSEQERQITRTEQLLKELNVENKWFAPPSGSFNQTTIQVARDQGLLTVLWTIDTIDWRRPPAATVVTRVTTQLEPGALILMHPTISTAEAMPEMIKIIKDQGYSIGTVSNTLSSERLQDKVEGVDLF